MRGVGEVECYVGDTALKLRLMKRKPSSKHTLLLYPEVPQQFAAVSQGYLVRRQLTVGELHAWLLITVVCPA